jgi:general stress protein YciG
MAGTIEGGRKTAAKNKGRDPDFYKKIGAMGGSKKVPKGFSTNPALAHEVGAIGGRKSRRSFAKKPVKTSLLSRLKYALMFLQH